MTHRRNWSDDQRERYGSGNEERDEAGVIATLDNGEVIPLLGLCDPGAASDSRLRRPPRAARPHPLATPRTIIADLAVRDTYYNGLGRRTGALLPEQSLLGRIGRTDLYAGKP